MFHPHFPLSNKHLQTLYAPLFRKQKKPEVEIEVFELSDGDFVEAYWHEKKPKDKRPIVTLFHGLAGSFNSPYIQGVMKTLDQQGFASVIMHFRGCGKKENRLPRAYHSGDTADAKAWIAHIHKLYPQNPLFAVGYSIGGNMLLKLLGEEKSNTPLQLAVSVSAPMALEVCAEVISQGFAKTYEQHLLKPLRASLQRKYERFNMESLLKLKKEDIERIKTIEAFDEAYTAPINGFNSAHDYYAQCSAKQFLKEIKIPTLIIHAQDDPFMDERILPTEEELSPYVQIELQKHGGHVGFVTGSLFKPEYWLEKRIVTYFLEKA